MVFQKVNMKTSDFSELIPYCGRTAC